MLNRQTDPFTVRLPNGMRDQIKRIAEQNRRSMNSEIVFHLGNALEAQKENGPVEAATSPSHELDPTVEGKTNEQS